MVRNQSTPVCYQMEHGNLFSTSLRKTTIDLPIVPQHVTALSTLQQDLSRFDQTTRRARSSSQTDDDAQCHPFGRLNEKDECLSIYVQIIFTSTRLIEVSRFVVFQFK